MTTIVWNDVFMWVGRIVCGAICLTPLWIVLYVIVMVGMVTESWPWSPITNRIGAWRLKRRLERRSRGD